MAVARWVCIVCCRSLSDQPGSCKRCFVDRLDLDRADVREELDRRIDDLLEKDRTTSRAVMGGIATVPALIAAFFAAILCWDLILDLVPDYRAPLGFIAVVGMGVGSGVFFALRWLYVRLRPNSAEAILAIRHARAFGQNELGVRTSGTRAASLNPDVADRTDVLLAFGAKVE